MRRKETNTADDFFRDGCGRCSRYATPQCNVTTWKTELAALRSILLKSGLTEEIKWNHPCYTWNGKNIILLRANNGNCVLGFFKGVLMKDPERILKAQTENMQSVRQFQTSDHNEIARLRKVLGAYITEAIELEKSGKKVQLKKVSDYSVPAELEDAFRNTPNLKNAFYSLTPGRQKAYLLHFSQAKQPQTRVTRIERYREKIMNGKGMEDQ
jgi:uncharacterized protein YdeI (YjbR/CyaY-like superfamily)